MQQAEIGIIGGSGLYSMPGLTNVHEERYKRHSVNPRTFRAGRAGRAQGGVSGAPWTRTSSMPTEINFRANIYAMKKLGVERIISVSAVGSLKEEHKPADFVIPDQFIDRTLRSHFDVLWRRHCRRTSRLAIRSVRTWRRRLRSAARDRRRRHKRRNLRLHGRAAVFDARRNRIFTAAGAPT